jgi:AcrR family transcriptional regulator
MSHTGWVTQKPGTRPTRARDAETTRADLLKAARRRFAIDGYERTTSRDIAVEAGANVSLINRYFGSKEGLFDVVLRESAGLVDDLRGITLPEFVDRFVSGFAPDAYPEYGHEHPLLLLLRAGSADERTMDLRQRTLRAVIAYLAEELAKSSDSPDVRFRAGILLSMLAGVLTVRAAVPQDEFAGASVEELRRQLSWLAQVISTGTPSP